MQLKEQELYTNSVKLSVYCPAEGTQCPKTVLPTYHKRDSPTWKAACNSQH